MPNHVIQADRAIFIRRQPVASQNLVPVPPIPVVPAVLLPAPALPAAPIAGTWVRVAAMDFGGAVLMYQALVGSNAMFSVPAVPLAPAVGPAWPPVACA